MCGIIGYAGSEAISNSVLIEGLRSLEYRGYDSAGIANVEAGQVNIIKAKGKVSELEDKMQRLAFPSGQVGIAHTRWATHGAPSERNSHPHQSGDVTLVHNGIIENYLEIKQELQHAGIQFHTDTDSEVACAYIDYCYKTYKDKHRALTQAYRYLRGSFAFGIIFADECDAIYAMRKNSPLVIGVGDHASFIGSDVSAFLKFTNRYIILEHDEIAHLREDGVTIKTLENETIENIIKVADMDVADIKKGGYEHFMLKEIHEEPDAVKRTIDAYFKTSIADLAETMPDLAKYEEIHIVACGSAMYAGMIAKSLIEKKAKIRVDCQVASEYRYSEPLYTRETLVILISQSGETADTIAALHLAKAHKVDTLAIVNVVGSSIARMADHVLYTLAGPEISVATTKAYCTQVALLSLVAARLADIHGYISDEEAESFRQEIRYLPDCMRTLISSTQYKEAAKLIFEHEDVYFLGRGLDYALSMEGSLKLKEISYIHSEAYAAGELKHGTISLIEQDTPVIALATNIDLYEKTISNIKEVRARGAKTILLATSDLPISEEYYDYKVIVPKTDFLLQGILTIIPLQLIAYETARFRGCEIDQPRNLAKSVTVE